MSHLLAAGPGTYLIEFYLTTAEGLIKQRLAEQLELKLTELGIAFITRKAGPCYPMKVTEDKLDPSLRN